MSKWLGVLILVGFAVTAQAEDFVELRGSESNPRVMLYHDGWGYEYIEPSREATLLVLAMYLTQDARVEAFRHRGRAALLANRPIKEWAAWGPIVNLLLNRKAGGTPTNRGLLTLVKARLDHSGFFQNPLHVVVYPGGAKPRMYRINWADDGDPLVSLYHQDDWKWPSPRIAKDWTDLRLTKKFTH